MKSKKVTKKLTLNKKTISDLNKNQMSQVRGGLMKSDPRVCNTEFGCTDFTWDACPPLLKSDYVVACCTEGGLCM